jgi:hypothetical protein
MTKNVTRYLEEWFHIKLSKKEQEEVLEFLYGKENLIKRGEYYGPYQGTEYKGLFMGPAPSSISHSPHKVCPTCGRPI